MFEYYEENDSSKTADIIINNDSTYTSFDSNKIDDNSHYLDYEKDSTESNNFFNTSSWKYIKNDSVHNEVYELKKFIYNELIESELIPYTKNKIESFISNNYSDLIFCALSDIFTENMNDSDILIKIIRCLSLIPHEALNSGSRLLIFSALFNNDRTVQQHAVETLGIWSDSKTIEMLKSIDCKDKWFEKYVNKIIKGIEDNNE